MDAFYAAPPITRTITALVALTSLAVYAGLIAPTKVIYFGPMIFTLKNFPPQVWRFLTAFWLTGPKLSIVLDPYFLFVYGSQLEKESTRFSTSSDFFVYVAFIHIAIILTIRSTHLHGTTIANTRQSKALCGGILGGYTFLQPLILAFVYTYAQDNPERRVSMFIFQFQAKYLPYAMLLMTFVMGSPSAAWEQATGLVAAHAFDFLTRIWPTFGGGRNYLATPQFVKAWFGDDRPAPRTTGYGTAFNAGGRTANSASSSSASVRRPAVAGAASSGWSSAFSGWGQRGTGRRLGGD